MKAVAGALWWALVLPAVLPHHAWAREPKPSPLWREGRASRHPRALSLPALVAQSRAGVVQVRGQFESRAVRTAGGRLSVGTGFVISPDGHLITNEHVVRDAEALQVRLFDGREVAACVVGVDPTTDIALLKAKVPLPLTPLPLGDPRTVRAGDDVFVIGSPFGFDHSVSAGILSAKDRIVDRTTSSTNPSAVAPYAFYLQTDAAINMGNSGGPLLSRQGFVIGVASAYWGGSQPAQGIGFAIPIDVVKQLLPQLATAGRVQRSKVGVDVQAVDALLAEAFALGTTRGALLAAIEPQGPAAKAGLKPGDLVFEWGNHEVAGVEDFKIYAQLTPPGQKVSVKVMRQKHLLRVLLETVAVADAPPAAPHAAACATGGVETLPALGLELATQPAKGGGLLVRKVGAGAARDAGLLPGDVILQVHGKVLSSPADFKTALSPSNQTWPLLVSREQASFWVALPPHQSAP